jgi:hypothetical protein
VITALVSWRAARATFREVITSPLTVAATSGSGIGNGFCMSAGDNELNGFGEGLLPPEQAAPATSSAQTMGRAQMTGRGINGTG